MTSHPKLSPNARTARAFLLVPLVLGVLIAVSFGAFLPMTAKRGWTGDQLDKHGVPAQAMTVKVGWKAGGQSKQFDGVRVTYQTQQGKVVDAELAWAEADTVQGPIGWFPPVRGSKYELPLELRYLPGDPETVMTRSTAAGLGRYGLKFAALFAGLALVGVLLVVGSLVGRRAIRRRALRSRT